MDESAATQDVTAAGEAGETPGKLKRELNAFDLTVRGTPCAGSPSVCVCLTWNHTSLTTCASM
jgi:hypothetical protein